MACCEITASYDDDNHGAPSVAFDAEPYSEAVFLARRFPHRQSLGGGSGRFRTRHVFELLQMRFDERVF